MKKKVLLMTLALALMIQSSVMAESTHKHKWVDDIKNSNETINRYTCECGATKDEVIADIRDYVITFDANGGYVEEPEKETYKGRIKWLPIPEHTSDYQWEGWFTEPEGGELVDVEGVEEAHAFRAGHDGALHVIDTEEIEEADDDDGVSEVCEDALAAVGDHGGDLTAHENDEQRNAQEEGQKEHIDGNVEAEDVDVEGESAVIDHEAGAHGGEESIVDKTGDKGQHTGVDAEAAAVALLEELGHGERAGFTEAVENKARKGHQQRDDDAEVAPEAQRKTGFVVLFKDGHQRDEAHAGGTVGDSEQIASGFTSGRQEVGDAADITFGAPADIENGQEGEEDDHPVQPLHVLC